MRMKQRQVLSGGGHRAQQHVLGSTSRKSGKEVHCPAARGRGTGTASHFQEESRSQPLTSSPAPKETGTVLGRNKKKQEKGVSRETPLPFLLSGRDEDNAWQGSREPSPHQTMRGTELEEVSSIPPPLAEAGEPILHYRVHPSLSCPSEPSKAGSGASWMPGSLLPSGSVSSVERSLLGIL